MELLRNLFEGYPNLWGGGVAHSVLILSLVITFGIMLGKLKVAGISLGVTWILFVGIVFGHFDMNLDEHLLHFLKVLSLKRSCTSFPTSKGMIEAIIRFCPSCSTTLRSSGWKMTITAVIKALASFDTIHRIVFILKI